MTTQWNIQFNWNRDDEWADDDDQTNRVISAKWTLVPEVWLFLKKQRTSFKIGV
jgi:hypothetical protein